LFIRSTGFTRRGSFSSSVLDMIGRTPLVRLHRFESEVPAGIELYARPSGRIRAAREDRAAAR
jgi:hypothetical protein